MFNFLKNLLKIEPKKEDISTEQLKQWFLNKTEPLYSKFNIQLKDVFSSIPEQINSIKSNITNLENANIKDEEKIEPKVKQVVLGNRINYIRVLSQFIDKVEIPQNFNYETSNNFCSQITEKLDELSKNTGKSFYTVQHLFPDQVEAIAKNISSLSKSVKSIKSVAEKNKIQKIEEIKIHIQILIKSIEKKERLKQELEQIKTRLENSKKMKQEDETKIEHLKNSKEYNEFNRLKQQKDDINIKTRSIENQIIELFSQLTPALKKFQRVTLEYDRLVKEYAENPVKALLQDQDLKIITLLQNMKKSILSNSIDIRDKKREKTLERIQQITQEQLKNIVEEHKNLKQTKEGLNNKLKTNRTMSLLEELQYKHEHHLNMIEKLRKDISDTEDKIENINIEHIKEELQNKIKESINTELDIKLPSSNP
ncbi:hypothetical protein KY342_01625 [Candidatus Woesearchaeota archaeon]|nr:hypothetical protein [Candidatus Woesearchaeota archaeon]